MRAPPVALLALCALLCALSAGSSAGGVTERAAAALRAAKRYSPGGLWLRLRGRAAACRHCGRTCEEHHGAERFCTRSAETVRRKLEVVRKLQAIDAFLRRCKNRLRGRWEDGAQGGVAFPDGKAGALRGGAGIDYAKWDALDVRGEGLHIRQRRRVAQEARHWDLRRRAEEGDFSSEVEEGKSSPTDADNADAASAAAQCMVAQEGDCTKIATSGENTSRRGNGAAYSGQPCSVGYMRTLTTRRDTADNEQSTCMVECHGGGRELTTGGIPRDAGKQALHRPAAHEEFVPSIADIGQGKSNDPYCKGFIAGCRMDAAGVGAVGVQESSRVVHDDGRGITKRDGLVDRERLAGVVCSANAADAYRDSTPREAGQISEGRLRVGAEGSSREARASPVTLANRALEHAPVGIVGRPACTHAPLLKAHA